MDGSSILPSSIKIQKTGFLKKPVFPINRQEGSPKKEVRRRNQPQRHKGTKEEGNKRLIPNY
ncbi:MAG: hypothetical protein ACRCT1_02480 [Microcoleaceae cyanobacterium]